MKYILAIIMLSFTIGVEAQDTIKAGKKPIDKVNVWKDGKVYDADDIEIVCVYNDMNTLARFYYRLKDSTGAVVSDGNVEIKGDDYQKLSTLNNWNDRATVMVMKALNVNARRQGSATQAARQLSTGTAAKN
jgi:hypothetical protein